MTFRRAPLALILAVLASITACSDRPQAESALTPSEPSDDQGSPICRLFSTQQIGTALGTPVEAGHTSGPLGSGCSWPIAGQDRSVMVQVVPRDYWEDGTRQPGGEAIEGVGEKAFVGPWIDDYRAGALTANGAVYVMSPSKAASVTLLRDVATRVPPQ